MGSSPHVRGARDERDGRLNQVGIIPACAGSTQASTGRRFPPGDHPRMCGEHATGSPGRRFWKGSSPHVRGARRPRQRHGRVGGIIPACAGSTACGAAPRPASRDHPRMCGEHHFPLNRSDVPRGSSPHVRGAPLREGGKRLEGGIIPACAGSTRRTGRSGRRTWDHPRMCGEHSPALLLTTW